LDQTDDTKDDFRKRDKSKTISLLVKKELLPQTIQQLIPKTVTFEDVERTIIWLLAVFPLGATT
jgi:hypothetical protein